MLAFIGVLFRNVLLDISHLAIGCIFVVAASIMRSKGVSIKADGRPKRFLAVTLSSLAGALLPLGSFGAVPIVAAAWIAGLELPVILPLLVSNFLFNLSLPLADVVSGYFYNLFSIPLTDDVYVWNGFIAKSTVAVLAGMISGAMLLRRGGKAGRLLRESSYKVLFEEQIKQTNYLRVFRRYFETAGLFIFAAAVLNTAFFLYARSGYLLYEGLLSTGFGMSVTEEMSGLNVFNPFFEAATHVLGRLADFSALAAMLLIFKVKNVLKLYAYCIVIILLLSVSLFIG